jgi:hypothetical protein
VIIPKRISIDGDKLLENSQNSRKSGRKPDLKIGTCLNLVNSFVGCD